MSIAARAAKSITWTFDTSVTPDNDIIREHVLLEGGGIFTGKSVTVERAMGFVPVLAAIRLRSETIASLPLPIYRRLERGKQVAPDHRLYSLLHDQANPEMSAFVFKETAQAHVEAWGNLYAEIEFDTDGFPLYLWPLRPDQMTVYRENGKRIYLYRTPDGKDQRLSARQVFHVPGMGYDGRIGYSPIHMARQAIALGQAAEEMAGRFYANDARPGIAIKLGPEYDYDDDAKKRLAESFDATHAGLKNKHRTAVLDEGMGIEQFGFPADDAQLVEQQKWSVEQVCRIFNIPPHMLHSLERATFNNIEELGLNFVTYSLRPWLVRWEQQIKMQLLGDDSAHFAEFNVDGLLRGKLEDRMKSYWQMFQMSAISADEIRAKENLNPLPDGLGEAYYHPVNIAPVEGEPEEPVVPEGQLPPLRLVGTRSTKAVPAPITDKYAPLFEDVTRNLIDLERRMVMREAEKRLAASQTESTKTMIEALASRDPANVEIKLPDSFKVEAPEWPDPPPAPVVHVHTDSFVEAIAEMKEMMSRPRTRTVVRDATGQATHSIEELAPLTTDT